MNGVFYEICSNLNNTLNNCSELLCPKNFFSTNCCSLSKLYLLVSLVYLSFFCVKVYRHFLNGPFMCVFVFGWLVLVFRFSRICYGVYFSCADSSFRVDNFYVGFRSFVSVAEPEDAYIVYAIHICRRSSNIFAVSIYLIWLDRCRPGGSVWVNKVVKRNLTESTILEANPPISIELHC